MLSFIVLLIVAGVCGSIGRAIGGGSRGGCLVSIALGFIGAVLGMWLARTLDLPMMLQLNLRGQHFPILWSIIGSALFVAVLSFFTRRRD
ncbi:MAG TPA: GlsB/YeaQ/YmgE family stress response membrane protein [Blastocatellia bacterium]|nr:GlsB/YeaQ/YmgE family stress response membrane protein [Blastocatellia bacterium]